MARALSATSKANLAIGLVLVAIAAVFWSQRNYSSPYGGTFPDPIIIVLGVLGLALAVLGLLGKEVSGGDDQDLERLPLGRLAIAVVVLAAWAVSLPYLGYIAGGILFFTMCALLMRKTRPTWKGVLLDVVVATGLLFACDYVFREFLYVQLPLLQL